MPEPVCLACLEANSGLSVCPYCGWSLSTPLNPEYLPPGYSVSPPYQIARVLGHGGFGITYLGWDANLQTKVAIKEYLPRDFARRDPVSRQIIPHLKDIQTFKSGLNSFLEEARILAKFQQHPGIVSVLTFFRALGAGYMVMEYIEGETLLGYLQQRGRLNWEPSLDIFMHIMDALRSVHAAGLLHRDIAPDNIYLCRDGRIKLLDFGAAQQSLGKFNRGSESSTLLIKQGFAPIEQYHHPSEQGPWSDVYSLAASLYYCLTGLSPPDALQRLNNDQLIPPSALGVKMPIEAEQALMIALAVDPQQRPQNIEALQKQLFKPQTRPVSTINSGGSQLEQTSTGSATSLPSDPVSQAKKFHWLHGMLIGMGCLFLLILDFRHGQNQTDKITSTTQQIESTEPLIHSEEDEDKIIRQTELERQAAAAEFKQQQAAALKRIEESSLQQHSQPGKPSQPDSRQTERLRSLCSEWGATMDCKNIP